MCVNLQTVAYTDFVSRCICQQQCVCICLQVQRGSTAIQVPCCSNFILTGTVGFAQIYVLFQEVMVSHSLRASFLEIMQIMLQTSISEVLTSGLGQDYSYPDFLMVFLSPSREMLGQYLICQSLSAIRCYIGQVQKACH